MQSSLSFTVARDSLSDALKQAARVTERRNTIPILSYVLFTVSSGCVRLTATDLDVVLTCELPAAADVDGRLCVPLAVLKDAIGKLKVDSVTIEDLGNGRAVLSAVPDNGARVILGTMKPDDFPVMVEGDMLTEFTMPAGALGEALAAVMPFTSTEETRYYLMGAFIHAACSDYSRPRTAEHETLAGELAELRATIQSALQERGGAEGEEAIEDSAKREAIRERVEGEIASVKARIDVLEAERTRPDVLRFATTDGHRLGRYTLPLPEGADGFPDMILPTKAANLVFKHLIGKKPDRPSVRIRTSRTKMEFTYGRFRVLAKVIDGTFPDYTRVIPSAETHKLTVPAAAFAEAVESVTAIAREKTRAVAISMSNDDGVILTCSSPQNGRAAAIFGGAYEYASHNPGLAIGFNAKYLTGILSAFPGDVTFGLSDCAGPVRIESPNRPEFLGVLMPMRVGEVVTTRADVEALTLSPLLKLERKANDIAKAIADAQLADSSARGHVLKAIAAEYIKPAIAFLVDQGDERHIARLKVKYPLAMAAARLVEHSERYAATAEAERGLAMIARFGGSQIGALGFKALTFRPSQDPEPQDPAALDPAEAEAEAAPVAACDAPVIVEAVAAEGPVSPAPDEAPEVPEREWVTNPNYPDAPEADPMRPACEPVDVVKALTVTDQAVFVALADWNDESISSLKRYHADGFGMYGNGQQRTILRANLQRLVPARNRGDRPIAAVKAPPADSSVAERLASLERLVAGMAPDSVQSARVAELETELTERIREAATLRTQLESARSFGEAVTVQRDSLWRRRSCARRMVRHALKLRQDRAELRAQLQRTEACLEDARASASRLATRCDALERFHAASEPLDRAAAGMNGQPAIIMPAVRSNARVS
jgi:DNA polymerase III sliding clamp (beta) subunit (PCNA family)